MKSGRRRGERRERTSVDEDSAHLNASVITTVGFLRVQIYKTDLRETKRERQNIQVTVGTGRLYHKKLSRSRAQCPRCQM